MSDFSFPWRLRPLSGLVVGGLLLLAPVMSAAGADGPTTPDQPKNPEANKLATKTKEIAGVAEFLRSVPKRFATLKAVDVAHNRVALLVEGESLAKEWDVAPDAEIKVAGWWGRLDQLTVGDRVWVWFQTNRAKQPTAISMLADELSEQDMHGSGVLVQAHVGESLTIKPVVGKSRSLQTTGARFLPASGPATTLAGAVPVGGLKAGAKVYVQSAGERARLVVAAEVFETLRNEQKAALRKRWVDEGLPGTVTFLHRFSGEMDYLLDHEAMRWGRSLQPGDSVTLQATPPIKAVVKHVQPWRERTQLRLVVAAADQGDLALGQRVRLRMTPPPAAVELTLQPPDLDLPRTKAERIEWFLASIYCTCGVQGDRCTGHFYTLASCNPNGCGMPNAMRKRIAEKIDQGWTDLKIFDDLFKEYGPILVRPHLLP